MYVCVGSGGVFQRRSVFLLHFMNNNIHNKNQCKELGLLSWGQPKSPRSASCWNEVGKDRLGLEERAWLTLGMCM